MGDYWKEVSRSTGILELENPDGWYKATVRFDGCIHFYRYYNTPFTVPNRPKNDGMDYLHICDLDDEINRLKELQRIAKNWGSYEGT